jgi:hypothetical protein
MTQSEQIFGKSIDHPLRQILLLAQLLRHLPGHRRGKRNQLIWSPRFCASKGSLVSAFDRGEILRKTAGLLCLRRTATFHLRLRSRWLVLVGLGLSLLQRLEDFRHKTGYDQTLRLPDHPDNNPPR